MTSNYANPTDTVTDIVSLCALHLSATIGPDHWHRTRSQPIQLSIYLHLAPLYLDAPGRSDNVSDSLHYGHLTKAVERRVSARAEQGYAHPRALIEDVTDAAFEFAKDAAIGAVHAVRVMLSLPKQILLAGGFEVEITTSAAEWVVLSAGSWLDASIGSRAGAIVRVTDMVLPVLIGVNPPERLAKQRVVTNLTFFEAAHSIAEGGEVDYPAIIQEITTDIERSSYLTLEKLVYEIIRTGYRASDVGSNLKSDAPDACASRIKAITVYCRKLSALSFADASGVEMTRTRDALADTR